MRDYLPLGPTPSDEPCGCVGEENYADRARAECKRFMALLRHTFGPEPAGAQLAAKWFDHDFGRYCEVVCWFDTDIPESMDYAFRCDAETPTTWEG
jgi:hypothetical protein